MKALIKYHLLILAPLFFSCNASKDENKMHQGSNDTISKNMKTKKEIEWRGTDTTYEGSPLFLRLPSHENIWKYQKNLPKLLCITHTLDKITDRGLPQSDYNKSLFDFDGELCDLFENENEGIIVLIETYGGARNYWYYISKKTTYKDKFETIVKKYPEHKLEIDTSDDIEWSLIKEYPVKLYPK